MPHTPTTFAHSACSIDDDLRQASLVANQLKGPDQEVTSSLGYNVVHPNYGEIRDELKNLPSEMRHLSMLVVATFMAPRRPTAHVVVHGIKANFPARVGLYRGVVAPNSVWALRGLDRTCQADVSSDNTSLHTVVGTSVQAFALPFTDMLAWVRRQPYTRQIVVIDCEEAADTCVVAHAKFLKRILAFTARNAGLAVCFVDELVPRGTAPSDKAPAYVLFTAEEPTVPVELKKELWSRGVFYRENGYASECGKWLISSQTPADRSASFLRRDAHAVADPITRAMEHAVPVDVVPSRVEGLDQVLPFGRNASMAVQLELLDKALAELTQPSPSASSRVGLLLRQHGKLSQLQVTYHVLLGSDDETLHRQGELDSIPENERQGVTDQHTAGELQDAFGLLLSKQSNCAATVLGRAMVERPDLSSLLYWTTVETAGGEELISAVRHTGDPTSPTALAVIRRDPELRHTVTFMTGVQLGVNEDGTYGSISIPKIRSASPSRLPRSPPIETVGDTALRAIAMALARITPLAWSSGRLDRKLEIMTCATCTWTLLSALCTLTHWRSTSSSPRPSCSLHVTANCERSLAQGAYCYTDGCPNVGLFGVAKYRDPSGPIFQVFLSCDDWLKAQLLLLQAAKSALAASFQSTSVPTVSQSTARVATPAPPTTASAQGDCTTSEK
ncbi:uncharacterized protein EHS24_006249 [Apiotrichum porosum]|uniref:Uncharacterized protein n=1 Tax=Apiotrichum porosum TaxID=105984 RepID=A0A427Y154_9TREE|nr:uncharacterized protein EHS24_006249 [Apiotrichum porosum]RSH84725.1 hypothetical protein EHS24_006249 [Apiotrichum porosum]